MVDRRDEEEEEGGRPRLRLLLALGGGLLVLALLAGGVFMLLSGAGEPVRKVQLTVVNILPPPPPPPPPPTPPPPPPEQKVMEEPIKNDRIDEKPKDEKPEEPPPGPLAMDAKGEGPGDLFGLGGKLGGKGLLGSGGGGGGSRWGWYASIVQSKIESALKANEKTRTAVTPGTVIRIWADASGRVSRVLLEGSTGNKDLDAAFRDQISGITFQPPPKDMPMPIITRVTERGST